MFTTAGDAAASVALWFNDARVDQGSPAIKSIEDLDLNEISEGLVDISDPHFEDLVFSVTRVAVTGS